MTDSRVRTAIVGVRCTPAEHADIGRAAAARGMSASAYLRDLHERATATPAEGDAEDLAELIGELRDDSENLGTLALNAEGEHNYHDAMLLRGIGMDVERTIRHLASPESEPS